MKIFISEDGNKVNFVDELNNFVGYDLSQRCCEQAYFRLYYYANNNLIPAEKKDNFDNYYFEDIYFENISKNNFPKEEIRQTLAATKIWHDSDTILSDSNYTYFILASKNAKLPKLILILYNIHNGYYSHLYEYGLLNTDKIEGGSL